MALKFPRCHGSGGAANNVDLIPPLMLAVSISLFTSRWTACTRRRRSWDLLPAGRDLFRKSGGFHDFYGEIREDVGDILDINGRRGIYWRYNGKLVQQTV